ncbi:hypothetical protein LCGC14_2679260, partial [marine sediment metagenome]
DHVTLFHELSSADVLEVHVIPSGEVIALSPVPLEATIANRPNSEDQTISFQALFEAVKSLAHVRDFVGTLISDKHLKWQTYVDLTDAMKIPDINQLLAKTKVEL